VPTVSLETATLLVKIAFLVGAVTDGLAIIPILSRGPVWRYLAIHYDKQRLYVRQVMTHSEYDRNDWRRK
jgi:mRNA-degrading endonuclease HigB of HigAB toxin-antitoxin module